VWLKSSRNHAGVTESPLDRDHVEAISRYDEAWAEVDDARRLALLKAIWADDGVYFRWACTYGDGESLDGVDFVEFGSDGRIQRLTNFYPA